MSNDFETGKAAQDFFIASIPEAKEALVTRPCVVRKMALEDWKRAVDALAALGDADSSRMGIMGISGGGLVASFATVLDPRFHVCVISGYARVSPSVGTCPPD